MVYAFHVRQRKCYPKDLCKGIRSMLKVATADLIWRIRPFVERGITFEFQEILQIVQGLFQQNVTTTTTPEQRGCRRCYHLNLHFDIPSPSYWGEFGGNWFYRWWGTDRKNKMRICYCLWMIEWFLAKLSQKWGNCLRSHTQEGYTETNRLWVSFLHLTQLRLPSGL